MKMGIPQTLDPNTKPLPKGGDQKIALVGGGPASISCACFLARLGYKNITVYEKEKFLGGLRFVWTSSYKYCTYFMCESFRNIHSTTSVSSLPDKGNGFSCQINFSFLVLRAHFSPG